MTARRFEETLAKYRVDLDPLAVDVLQVNITRLCNQACKHCHVDASPRRTEMMTRRTVRDCLAVLDRHPSIRTLDITGGAPELHPDFDLLVSSARSLGRKVLVRHNLTVTLDPHPVTGTSMRHLPRYFAEKRVELFCSLPCYSARITDEQRGNGAFAKSIESLRLLNEEGFGVEETGLVLNLVTNPAGSGLPGCQRSLEAAFRRQLQDSYGVTFSNLLALANMPVNRFARQLGEDGAVEEYLDRLAEACNPVAVRGVMCRSMVSVGWDGTLYDCDFNQMLGLAIGEEGPLSVTDYDEAALLGRRIRFADHCLGCTAGSGSSCGGATAA